MTQKLPKTLMMSKTVHPWTYALVLHTLGWHRLSISCYPPHQHDRQLGLTMTDCLSDTERKHACTLTELSLELRIPQLHDMLQQFLFQITHHNDPRDPNNVPLEECPYLDGKVRVKVYHSSTVVFLLRVASGNAVSLL